MYITSRNFAPDRKTVVFFANPASGADSLQKVWGPFLEGSEKFSDPENRSKISNPLITELFY